MLHDSLCYEMEGLFKLNGCNFEILSGVFRGTF